VNDLSLSLSRFPRARVIQLPTPFEAISRLGQVLGGPHLFVKRDDCTGLALGGNKTRKLQYVVGAALKEGVDTLITTGGIQSNHARQTAAFAARLGLRCELVLQHVLPEPSPEYLQSGNVLLDRLLGAMVHIPPLKPGDASDAVKNLSGEAALEEAAEAARRAGHRPCIVPLGASTGVGALGYAECAQEIVQQSAALGSDIDWVVLASGSAGTQAGLIAGFKALGARTRVLGVAVSGETQDVRAGLVRSIATETARLLGWKGEISADDVHVNGDYVGAGYGFFGEDVIEALCMAARTEALLIDPVYTGKALQGLWDLSRKGFFKKDENVVFLHTGGIPGLFAYREPLLTSAAVAAQLLPQARARASRT
jgi:L-cysteate sulfo-lyase